MAEIQISLEAARVNAKLTQVEIADIMGVDQSTIRRWERGEKVPNYDEIKKISSVYKIPIDNIFSEKELAKSKIRKRKEKQYET